MKFSNFVKKKKLLFWLWKKYDWYITKYQLKKDVKILPNKVYKRVFRKDINWDNPKSLIEKIYWLQLYSDTSLWTLCADKYKVRSFVEERGCGDILNELYGVWTDANDIDWEKLPDQFVLKTNNSCGKMIIVKDKKELNVSEAVKKLNSWLKIKYGYRDGQYHYTKIPPCIIAEKLLKDKKNGNKPLTDYKIFCFDGVPESVLVVHDRRNEVLNITFYDLEWNNISSKTLNDNSIHVNGMEVSRPKSFDKMIECAKKLSRGIPQVRVDFYEVEGKVVFGEMTFTTGGYGSYLNEYYDYLGSKVDLSKINKRKNPNRPLGF